MPVTLEHITNPSLEDNQDLVKIYQNYPQPMIDDCKQWINTRLTSGDRLFVGRFNGRIVGSVWAVITTDSWQLEHLCVRDITRRRGVARQLLNLLTHRAAAEAANLSINDDTGCIINPLLLELGFTLSKDSVCGNIWQNNHR